MTRSPASRDVTALVVGHVTHDRYADGYRAGGSAFYGARALDVLGARPRLVSTVGRDFERHLELRGLEILVKVTGVTTAFENSYPIGGRRVQRIRAIGEAVTPRSLPAEWRKSDVLFLAPVAGEIDAAVWLESVDADLVGLGLQGFLRAPGVADEQGWHSVVPRPVGLDDRLLERVSAVFLSDEDLAGFGSPELLERLKSVVPTVVLTLGVEGSRVWTRGRETRVGAFPVVAKDPTGAGDVFAAAFLLATAQGATPVEAARFGSAAASIVVEGQAGAVFERLSESSDRAARVAAGRPAS